MDNAYYTKLKAEWGRHLLLHRVSWIVNFFTTIVVSLLTKPKPPEELKGLVYSLTEKQDPQGGPWYQRVVPLALIF